MRAFLKKEYMELCRSGRLLMLVLIFALFGIMNPAMAKLTPWLMETLSDSLAEAGFATMDVTVDAMTSWAQFYKNIPMGLIFFVLIFFGCFTGEYQKGTLVPVVTKGLSRRKIVLAKSLVVSASWTASYWLCFGITYGYNAFFWDNRIAAHLLFAGALTWLFGIWITALLLFFSTVAQSGTQVLFGTGGVAMGVYLLGMFPKLGGYLPVKLLDGLSLLHGAAGPEDYYIGMAAALSMVVLCMVSALVCFDRKGL